MSLFTVNEVARLTGADLVGENAGASVTAVTHDSREVESGHLFVAIRGDRTDGHLYLDRAFAAGAVAALVDHVPENADSLSGVLCVVPDTVRALGLLGQHHRSRFPVPIYGITGSMGKTTTKEMAAKVLGARYSVLRNPGNLNTDVGLPLALFGLHSGHQMVLLEMGARKKGDIKWLCDLTRPQGAVLTNVSESHLEAFGSIDAVASTKGELVEALPSNGFACLNGDDPRVRAMSQLTRGRVILFGYGTDSEVRGLDPSLDDNARATFTLSAGGRSARVSLPVPGLHQVQNALAAAALGHGLDLDIQDIIHGLESHSPPAMRMSLFRTGGLTVLDDTYNASPTSGREALRTLKQLRADYRVAILGDMLELGPRSYPGHLELGAEVPRSGVDLLVTVGDLAGLIREGALRQGFPAERAIHYRTVDGLMADVALLITGEATVLVKGSRGMRMERVVACLREIGGTDEHV